MKSKIISTASAYTLKAENITSVLKYRRDFQPKFRAIPLPHVVLANATPRKIFVRMTDSQIYITQPRYYHRTYTKRFARVMKKKKFTRVTRGVYIYFFSFFFFLYFSKPRSDLRYIYIYETETRTYSYSCILRLHSRIDFSNLSLYVYICSLRLSVRENKPTKEQKLKVVIFLYTRTSGTFIRRKYNPKQ